MFQGANAVLNEYNGQGIIDDNGTIFILNFWNQSKLTTVSTTNNNNWINNDNF